MKKLQLLFILFIIFTITFINNIQAIEITAHRGYSSAFPQNTMSAFIGANNVGSNYIELDIRRTSDGVLVTHHDSTLKKTAGVKRSIKSMTWSELKNYNVARKLRKSTTYATVPTLDEVLSYVAGTTMKVNIELKKPGYEQEVIDLVNKYKLHDRVLISSFDYGTLLTIENIDATLITALTISYGINPDNFDRVDGYSIKYGGLSKPLIDAIHARGKFIHAWTINTKKRAKKVKRMGVDNIITDNPAKIKKYV